MNYRAVPPEIAAAQQVLVERLRLVLEKLPQALQSDVILALEGEGKLLSSPLTHQQESRPSLPAGVWPLLVYFVARTISPNGNQTCASYAALAVECMALSIDLDDDVMDGDQTTTLLALGVARTVIVSRTLALLAIQLLLALEEEGVPRYEISNLINALLAFTSIVMAGQHRDIMAERQDVTTVTYEQCIEIAQAKAGALMSMACAMGAISGGANDETLQQFTRMGELLGISHQLDNDSHDFEYLVRPHETDTIKTDILRGKKTLPVYFAAEQGMTLLPSPKAADTLNEEQLRVLHAASVKTWGICLLYRRRVRNCLYEEIGKHHTLSPALLFLLGIPMAENTSDSP